MNRVVDQIFQVDSVLSADGRRPARPELRIGSRGQAVNTPGLPGLNRGRTPR
jgi:hypothetical protein